MKNINEMVAEALAAIDSMTAEDLKRDCEALGYTPVRHDRAEFVCHDGAEFVRYVASTEVKFSDIEQVYRHFKPTIDRDHTVLGEYLEYVEIASEKYTYSRSSDGYKSSRSWDGCKSSKPSESCTSSQVLAA